MFPSQLVASLLLGVLDFHQVRVYGLRGGGGQAFSRVIISFGLEVAPYMTGTFGVVFGPRNHTVSEPSRSHPPSPSPLRVYVILTVNWL